MSFRCRRVTALASLSVFLIAVTPAQGDFYIDPLGDAVAGGPDQGIVAIDVSSISFYFDSTNLGFFAYPPEKVYSRPYRPIRSWPLVWAASDRGSGRRSPWTGRNRP